jgi:hypothetical protein
VALKQQQIILAKAFDVSYTPRRLGPHNGNSERISSSEQPMALHKEPVDRGSVATS